MPLTKEMTKEIGDLIRSGHDPKTAVARAYANARKAKLAGEKPSESSEDLADALTQTEVEFEEETPEPAPAPVEAAPVESPAPTAERVSDPPGGLTETQMQAILNRKKNRVFKQ